MFKSKPQNLQGKIVQEIAKQDLRKGLSPAKTTFGKWIQNRKVASFERAKLRTLKDISRRNQSLAGKIVEAGRDLGTTLIATETGRDLANPNSYRTSLAAWTKNISGNPNPETGDDGQTQGGSTSELGG